MKRSRGCSLIHRPVILSSFQAEGVKKKEACEKVIENLLCVRLRQKEHCSCVDSNTVLLALVHRGATTIKDGIFEVKCPIIGIFIWKRKRLD